MTGSGASAYSMISFQSDLHLSPECRMVSYRDGYCHGFGLLAYSVIPRAGREISDAREILFGQRNFETFMY